MTTYVVEVTAETAQPLTTDQLEELIDRADERDWTLSRRGDASGWTVAVWLDADDIGHATQSALEQVRSWTHDPVVAVHTLTADAYAAAAGAPTIPELASATDAAHILGVSRQRIYQLRTNHPRFPAPIAEVALGPLWTRDAIEWFGTIWTRQPGRPAANAGGSTVAHLPQRGDTHGEPRLRA